MIRWAMIVGFLGIIYHKGAFVYATSAKLQQLGFSETNEVTKRVGQMKNVPVFDFASVISKDKHYWVDGRYNNEQGVKLKAELFARYIYNHRIIAQDINNLANLTQ